MAENAATRRFLGAQAATSEEGCGVAMAIFGHSALPDFMNKVGQFNIFNDLADHEVNRRLVLNNVISAYINLLTIDVAAMP